MSPRPVYRHPVFDELLSVDHLPEQSWLVLAALVRRQPDRDLREAVAIAHPRPLGWQ